MFKLHKFVIMCLLSLTQNMAQTPDLRTISTHILDTTQGQPAANVPVLLSRLDQNSHWVEITKSITNLDGRVDRLISLELFQSGIYKLRFDIADYHKIFNIKSFYPFVEIVFECKAGEHYHVPLLLNPFGYATYRGS